MTPSTIALVGDSQAQGTRVPLVRALEARGLVLTESRVQPGQSTERALADGFFDGPPVDLLFVLLGGNDLHGVSAAVVEAYRTRLAQSAELALARARRVVWVGPLFARRADVDLRHARAALVQRDVLPRRGVAWIDGRVLTKDAEFQNDGVHLARSSYEQLAEVLTDVVRSNDGARAIGTAALTAVALTGAGLAASILAR